MKKSVIVGAIIAVIVILAVGVVALIGIGTKNDNNDIGKVDENINFLDDNDSYFVIIDGKKFMAGDEIKDLSSVGYNLKSTEEDEEIPANKYMIGAGHMMNSENKNIFNVTPFNEKSSSIKVSEAAIGGIDISYSTAKNDEKSENFEVYGGIKLGSTMDEVKKVFGEPSLVTNGTTYTTYTYDSEETYRNYKFTFDEEGKVSDIQWKNLVYNK